MFLAATGNASRCEWCSLCEVCCRPIQPRMPADTRTCSLLCAAQLRKVEHPESIQKMIASSHTNEVQRAESIRRARMGKPRPELRGARHFNWKGGGSRDERHTAMQRVEYTTWRRTVFARDDYTCQEPGCGKRGGRLNAHHVKPWKDHHELRYDVDNGLTLCRGCHTERHRASAP